MEEERKIESQELEFLEIETEIKEFVRPREISHMDGNKTLKRKRRKRKNYYRRCAWSAIVAVNLIAAILLGIFLLQAPPAAVGLALPLEAALALCLGRGPALLHGSLLALMVIAGFYFSMPFLFLLAGEVYLVSALGAWQMSGR